MVSVDIASRNTGPWAACLVVLIGIVTVPAFVLRTCRNWFGTYRLILDSTVMNPNLTLFGILPSLEYISGRLRFKVLYGTQTMNEVEVVKTANQREQIEHLLLAAVT